jgi:ABC-type spermidine/putrescine transport system permease subunit II
MNRSTWVSIVVIALVIVIAALFGVFQGLGVNRDNVDGVNEQQ